MASEYLTEEERRAANDKRKAEKASADERISALTKAKSEQDAKLRVARKEKSEADKKAKDATLAANAKSATFSQVPPHYVVGPVTPIVAAITAAADGRVGSKEDVVSYVTGAVGLIGAAGFALTGNPTAALGFAVLMGGALSVPAARRARAAGERMRSQAGAPPHGA